MKDVYILGIESSCDETSVSIVKNGREVLSNVINSQIKIHEQYGGVVPEIASRMHTENITMVLEEVLNNSSVTMDDVDAIAVTYAPGLVGSLLVGIEFAKALAFAYDKPLIAVNHIVGHIYANNLVKEMTFPSLGLVVSGGHTELLLLNDDYDFTLLGSTLDDAIGECYDKIARIIGLPYPGGPNIEKYAESGKVTYEFPTPMKDESLNFSFSGLKSYIINFVHNEKQRGNKINDFDLAASFEDVALGEIIDKTRLAIKKTGAKNLIVAGGVSANKHLRQKLEDLAKEEGIDLSIPPIKYCTDNAAMIACAAYPLYKKEAFADFDLNARCEDKHFNIKD